MYEKAIVLLDDKLTFMDTYVILIEYKLKCCIFLNNYIFSPANLIWN